MSKKINFEAFNLNTLPGLENIDPNVFGYRAVGHKKELVPAVDPLYTFDPEVAPMFFAWAASVLEGQSDNGLLLVGPPGSGKSTLARNALAAMGFPMLSTIGHKSMEMTDLIGRMDLAGGFTSFLEGPLLQAYSEGYAFLHEEFDRTPASVTVAYNNFLDRATFVPELDAEAQPRHCDKKFLFIGTANSAGAGDVTGTCNTSVSFDYSTNDRLWTLAVGYPSKDQELKVLRSIFGGTDVPQDVMEGAITAANALRQAYEGVSPAGMDLSAVTTPISTRTLIRLIGAISKLRSYLPPGKVAERAIEVAIGNKSSAEGALAIRQVFSLHIPQIFG